MKGGLEKSGGFRAAQNCLRRNLVNSAAGFLCALQKRKGIQLFCCGGPFAGLATRKSDARSVTGQLSLSLG